MELTRINNDVNGNPRYVVHFLNLVKEDEKQLTISDQYAKAVKRANTIGGRKYRAKSYGGGIVFQSYNTDNLIQRIKELAQ